MSGRIAGRFTELRRLGEGGMGSVSLAHDHATGAACALKRLFSADDARGAARLQAEFAALSRVRHPALVEVRDLVFERGAAPILVMEFVPGLPADHVVGNGDVAATVRLGVRACEALAALHEASVVHGDLKPANLLVLPETPEDVRLVDLGLAALAGHERPAFAGTPGFAGPELRRGEPITPATDLFALGATLHALLTGSLPRASHSSDLSGDAGGLPSDARALEQAGAPPALVTVILQLMASAPSERPRDARAVARALARIVPDARPPLAARLGTVRFVGRERELARILAVHRRSARAPGRVLVLGESGSGKSALLEDIATRLRVESAPVALLPASGHALHALAVTVSAAAALAPPESAALTAWLEEPARALAPEDAETLLGWIAGCCMRLASESRTPAILVDDLGRHDAATRALLRRLALMSECRALHVWAAERPDAATARLAQAGEMMKLPLRPLTERAMHQLVNARLGAPAPEVLVRDLERHGMGHPGRVLERLRAVVESGALAESEERLVVSEERLRALAPATAEALALDASWAGVAGAGEVVLALALAPRALDAATLLRVAPAASPAAIERLAALRTLRSGAGLHRLASPALCEAWALSQPEAAIRAMRQRLLDHAGLTPIERFELLLSIGDDDAALALAAAIASAGDAAHIAAAAAAAAERAGHADAGTWHLRAAREARRVGRYAVAARAYRAASSSVSGADRFEATEGWLVSRQRVGDHDGLSDVCDRALAAAPPPRWRAPLLSLRSSLEAAAGLAGESLRSLDAAFMAAEEADSDGLRAQVLLLRGQTLLHLGRAEEALVPAEEAARLGEATRGPVAVRAAGLAGQALHRLGRSAEGIERLLQARQRATERGERFACLELLQLEAGVRMECGEWSVARELHEQALHLALALDLPRSAAVSAANRLIATALTGDLTHFPSRHRRALRLARRWSESARLDLAGRIPAVAALARGFPARARRRLERWLGDPRLRAEPALFRWSLLAMADAEDECGAADRAFAILDELVAERDSDLVGVLAMARRGLLCARQERDADAIADLARLEAAGAGRWAHAAAHAAALGAACALIRGGAAEVNARVAAMVQRFEALPAPHELAMALLRLTELALQRRRTEAAADLWLAQARERAERLANARAQILALGLGERWARMSGPAGAAQEDMTWLAEVGVIVQHIPHLPSLAQRAMGIVCRRLESERGVLVLADRVRPVAAERDRSALHVVATYGEVDDDARREALGFSRQVVEAVLRSGQGIRNSDITRDPQMVSKSLRDMRVRSVLCEPLVVGGRAIGAVYLQDRSRAKDFSPQDTVRLQTFARIMAAAIDVNWKQAANQEEHERLVSEHVSLKRSTGSRFDGGLLVGSHESMRRVNELIERVAHRDSMVLITGESGTGKELVARSIHAKSPRRDAPFISANCGAFPQTLIAAELFGIRSDVASGVTARPGLFERADGGTLFLDEIAEMPLEQQVTLLRVLQTREVSPLGAPSPVPIDVRVLAATNQKLEDLIRDGRFRSDLYYRLNVVPIHMPPLRERPSDLPLLAQHLATQVAARFERRVPKLSARFIDALMAHDWPGNVRELENYLERIMLMETSDVLEPEPPPGMRSIPAPADSVGDRLGPLDPELEALRRRRILQALEASGGNKSRAARLLGMGEQKLRFWIRRLGLSEIRNI